MPFAPGQSGNPAGRPKGITARRKRLEAFSKEHGDNLMEMVLERAKTDDATLRFLVKYILPKAPQETPIEVPNLPEGKTYKEYAGIVRRAISDEKIGIEDGALLMKTVMAEAEVEKVTELKTIIEKLERK